MLPLRQAPHFALNGRASDFAKATPDKSRGRQDRFVQNDSFSNFSTEQIDYLDEKG